jgi:HlyD family secretion protein
MQNSTDKVETFTKQLQSPRWRSLSLGESIVPIVLLIGGVGAGLFFWQSQKSVLPPAQISRQPAIKTITALGKLQPQGEVIKLSAPTSTNGNRVDRLLVKEGDRVKAGQIIAILDSRDRLQAALDESERQVASAKAKLTQIKAGAKSGEIGAQAAKAQQVQVEWQKDRDSQVDEITRVQAQWAGDRAVQVATINRLQATLKNAKSEFSRNQQLQLEGAISTSTLDTKKLALDTAQQQFAEAQATLNRIDRTSHQQLRQAQTKLQRINSSGQQQVASARATLAQVREVRSVDVQVAQAEIDRAIANAKQAKASLEQASVKAPQAGEVLYIHTRAGEVVATDGIVEIGQTQQMEAIAEVYQSDVDKVRLGQKAQVLSEAIAGKLTGTVSQIGAQVKRQTIVNTDPSTNIDARIVEVHVTLDRASSQKAARSTNLQVRVAIDK